MSKRTIIDGTERFVPEEFGPLPGYEHAHRYMAASLIFEKGRILDLASGSGVGTAALRSSGSKHQQHERENPGLKRTSSATQVIGLDFDFASARKSAPAVQGDATLLPFADASFDGVICFEAIEHMNEPLRLLEEMRRVLRRGGIALLSTPNRDLFSTRAGRINPFHISEVNSEEFAKLLSTAFSNVALYAQSVWAGSWLSELSGAGRSEAEISTRRWRVASQDLAPTQNAAIAPWADRADTQAPSPLYLMAVCSTSAKELDRVRRVLGSNHLLHDPAQWLLGHYLDSLRGLEKRDTLVESHAEHSRNLQKLTDESSERARSLETHSDNLIADLDLHKSRARAAFDHAANLEAERTELRDRIAALEAHAVNTEEIDGRRRSQIAELKGHAENLEIERTELQVRIKSLEEHASNVSNLDRTTRAHLAEHAANIEERDELRRLQFAGLEAHAENLEIERAQLLDRISALERHAGNIEARDEVNESRIAELEGHAENLEHERADMSRHALALEEHATNVAQQAELSRTQISSLENHARNVDAELETCRENISDLDLALATEGEHVAELQTQNENLSRAGDRWRELATGAEEDLAQLRASRTVRFVGWLRTRFNR